VRPRRLGPGDRFTWRFKTKDYWESVPAPKTIETVEELTRLHEPWVTSDARQVLEVIRAHRGGVSLNDEGLIVVELDHPQLDQLNAELAQLGCTVSKDLLHTV
jgi:hypothetical protein